MCNDTICAAVVYHVEVEVFSPLYYCCVCVCVWKKERQVSAAQLVVTLTVYLNKMFDDEDEFRSACHKKVSELRKKGAHLFLVCVDGSEQGEVAFHSIMNFRRKYDYIAMFHAFRGNLLISQIISLMLM
jgi:hypothetical protein